VTIYGNPSANNLQRLRSFSDTILLAPVGPILEDSEIAQFGIGTSDWRYDRVSVLVIYELDEGNIANSTLVAQSTPIIGGTDNTRAFSYFDVFDGIVLSAGKTYLLGVFGNGAGTIAPAAAYDGDQDLVTGMFYRFAVPYTDTAPATIGVEPLETLTWHMSVFVDTVAPGQLIVKNVNDTNTIVSGGPIVINGQSMSGADTVTVGGYPLTIISTTDTFVECEPMDVFASPIPFGATVPVAVSDATVTASIDVVITPPETIKHVTVDGVGPYLSQGLGVVDGDQMAVKVDVGASTLMLFADTDVLYSPAVADGTTHTRYWYDVSAGQWDSGQVTINGGAAPGVPSISMFTVLADTMGEATLKGKTDTTSGTVYAIVDASPTQPTNEQVRDGLNAAGAPALGKGSASVTTTDLAVTITGLPSDTLLYGWLAQWV